MLHMTSKIETIREDLRINRKTIQDAEEARGQLIAAARRAGIEWNLICDDTGLVRMTAHRYAARANDGKLPKPGDPQPRRGRRKA